VPSVAKWRPFLQNTNWDASTLLDNKITWGMDHVWCTSNVCACTFFRTVFGK